MCYGICTADTDGGVGEEAEPLAEETAAVRELTDEGTEGTDEGTEEEQEATGEEAAELADGEPEQKTISEKKKD